MMIKFLITFKLNLESANLANFVMFSNHLRENER